jgi:hypothetical protein
MIFVEDENGEWQYLRHPHPWQGFHTLGPTFPNGRLIPIESWHYPVFETATKWCPICHDELDGEGICPIHDYAFAREYHKAQEPYWYENVVLRDGQQIRVMLGGGYLE